MINPTLGMGKSNDLGAYRFAHGFPTRENCDPNNPREAFLWMLVALPGVNGAMLTMPISYNMILSEHLWECGVRLVEEPAKKWVAPQSTEPHWMTSPGRWVPAGEPVEDTAHPADVALASLTLQQKSELFERLKRMQEGGEFQ